MIQIAILGFGVVGSGTAEVLTENKKLIEERVGKEYNIRYILDLRDFPDSPFGSLVVHDFNVILNDPEVTVVAEMMGGSHPAYEFTRACLEAGKSVVTSNKEVVSTFGTELLEIARKNGVRYLFEASVGGGIPVIRPMMNDLSSNRIERISGILNGTTNYILTAMRDRGASFDEVLREAQALGYAEANPSADVDGIDAARKIVILAALATGKLVDPKTIPTEGITGISLADTKFAAELGYTVKLIGYAEMRGEKLLCFVAPRLIPAANPLGRIDDVLNGILLGANMVGEVMFYGPGAGKLPTASAVVADIIDIMANMDQETKPLVWRNAKEEDVASFADFSAARMLVFRDALPEAIKAYAEKTVSRDGLVACLTRKMTEAEADLLLADAGDSFCSSYRVL